MARRGPPPTPTNLKKLRGNPGKRKMPAKQIPSTGQPVVCPNWLSKEARQEWDRIVPLLLKMGLADAADEMALAAYCQCAAEVMIATRQLNKDGRYVKIEIRDRNGYKVGTRSEPHPMLVVQREALGKLRQFLVEFGLSPAARARIEVDRDRPGDQKGHDDLANLILQFNQPPPTTG